jgi:7-keto-8-aminopelargonate synthetase-like enzyme
VKEFTLPEPKKKLMKLNFATSSPPSVKKRSAKEIKKDRDNERRNKLREEARAARDEEENKQGLEDNPIEGAFQLSMTDEHAISLHNLLPEA